MAQYLINFQATLQTLLTSQDTYIQLGLILLVLLFSPLIAALLRSRVSLFKSEPDSNQTLRKITFQLGRLLSPLLSVLLLKIAADVTPGLDQGSWLMVAVITALLVYVFYAAVKLLVQNTLAAKAMLLAGIPLLTLQSLGILPYLLEPLETVAVNIGNIRISLLGILRVAIFGSLIYWLGRVTNKTGQEAIRRQERVDYRTRELAAKLYEIGIFFVVVLLLLQVMGINLTALAVLGGAIGVGLGFGLQSIASNFISGIIILLDRSLTVGDFIELEDGRSGYVTSLNMRSTTIETFEGKDIMVPNEVFITSSFTNWTHKNKKQRYRVDFSVAYGSDIRHLCEVIRAAVSEHPQVLSGEDYPIEERPDCEIDSFGDSGVNMFVEFWMDDIDDGKNRVGGDLLLTIYETMNEHGFTIPFPQREVRVLNEDGVTVNAKLQTLKDQGQGQDPDSSEAST